MHELLPGLTLQSLQLTDLPSGNRDSFYLTMDSTCFLDQIEKSSIAPCSTAAPCPSTRVHPHCLAVVKVYIVGLAIKSVCVCYRCREPGFPSTHVRWLATTWDSASEHLMPSIDFQRLLQACGTCKVTQAHINIISIIVGK